MPYQLDPVLNRVSLRFASELRDLTFAIERGQDITPRLRVLREFWRTWQELADAASAHARIAAHMRG